MKYKKYMNAKEIFQLNGYTGNLIALAFLSTSDSLAKSG